MWPPSLNNSWTIQAQGSPQGVGRDQEGLQAQLAEAGGRRRYARERIPRRKDGY